MISSFECVRGDRDREAQHCPHEQGEWDSEQRGGEGEVERRGRGFACAARGEEGEEVEVFFLGAVSGNNEM